MKRIVSVLVFVCLSLSLFAQGLPETVYRGEEGRITAYISGPAPMLDKLEAMFEAERGDVLDIVKMGCGPLKSRVWAEADSGVINADLFWGSDPLLFDALDARGMLEPYTPAGAEKLLPRFQNDKPYTFVNERYGVIIYNKNEVERPASYFDLADEKFCNRIVQADPAQSSTALAIVAPLWGIGVGDGDLYKQYVANGLYLSAKNSDVPSKIQEGVYLAGLAPHDAVWRLQKKAKAGGYESPLAISWPEEGAVAIQRPVAISRNSARPEANEKLAKQFIDFLISPKAQKLTANFGFIPVIDGVGLPKGMPADVKVLDIDWDELSENQYVINDAFEAIFE